MISLIVAKSNNNVIGAKNDLPWYIPNDLKYFKKVTLGCSVIMGKNTYKSIFERIKKPLPGRQNIIVSSTLKSVPEGFVVVKTIKDALAKADTKDVFIIGGEALYKSYLDVNLIDMLYVTEIDVEIEGDAFFPSIDTDRWSEVSRINNSADSLNPFNYDFVIYSKVDSL